MKRLLPFLLVLLVIFTGCGEDDEVPKDMSVQARIKGEWTETSFKRIITDKRSGATTTEPFPGSLKVTLDGEKITYPNPSNPQAQYSYTVSEENGKSFINLPNVKIEITEISDRKMGWFRKSETPTFSQQDIMQELVR